MTATGIGIRFYGPDDAESLFEAARESIADVHPWLPWCHPGYALPEAEEWAGLREHGAQAARDPGRDREPAPEKADAVREGVLRRRLQLHGIAHDAVVYSLVRSS